MLEQRGVQRGSASSPHCSHPSTPGLWHVNQPTNKQELIALSHQNILLKILVLQNLSDPLLSTEQFLAVNFPPVSICLSVCLSVSLGLGLCLSLCLRLSLCLSLF